MKTIIFGIVCLLGVLNTQVKGSNTTFTGLPVPQEDVDVFFIVKTAEGKESIVRALIIDNNDIDSLEYLTTAKSEAKFGKSNKPRAVLVVQVKPSVNLLNRQQFLEHYNISKEHQSLPFMLDGKKVEEPGTLLADFRSVHSVRIENNGSHIAIVTKYYPNRRQKEKEPSRK